MVSERVHSLGTRGAVGGTYNFATPLYTKLIEAFEAGDLAGARKLQKSPGSFHSVGKSVMTMLGIDCGPVRSPLANITQMQYENLKSELGKIGFFEYSSLDKTPNTTKIKLANYTFGPAFPK